ncbi:alpha/beta-hydrolase [Apiospora marii]|uniref:alpha/beta-hydrolase n=1 Tax=Apiospora marii TaxID=335849 RepID=UPI003131C891
MKGGQYFAVADGANIYYSLEGPEDGIPVLLLHGWVCDQNDWALQFPFLVSLGFRVIAMDYRGHGHSSVTDVVTKFDPVTLAEDAAALLEHLGVHGSSSSNGSNSNGNGNHSSNDGQQAIVMGHSIGALVAHQLALRHAPFVRGAVLVDAAYTLTPPIMTHVVQMLESADPPEQAAVGATDFFAMGGMYLAEHGTPAWLAPSHQRRAWAMEPRVIIETFRQMRAHLGESGAAYLARTGRAAGVPRLVTNAAEGNLGIEREAGGAEEEGNRMEVIPAGHFHHMIRPDRFNEVLGEWLGERGWVKEGEGTKAG